ncbi:MAG: flagellar export chaperone FliS [Peptoclostridium sp.]|uniref:flagellar export chaperone FliS n=1 Tax=Peptoclostridium sp. TaxID=1904860 RepID=UPI00139C88DA|nr:flagellar export chaperone FliS [Peptoclostridium sp.]MZQ75198.1 flagellar export chaperone FliS [Peptoclostridium sp.]
MIEKEYLAVRVASSNDAQLVSIVYEGLIDSLNESIEHIKDGEIQKLNLSVDKCRDIIAELIATLSGDSEIAMNYKSLYIYLNSLITEAHIKKDTQKFEEAKKIVTPLHEGWSELGEKLFQESVEKGNGTAVVSGMTYGKGYVNDQVSRSEIRWEKG